jgi:hypothetical protein
MSEDKARFRIKKGEIEIEYEGKTPEVTARYKEAFGWMKSVTLPTPKPEPTKKPTKEEEPQKKEERRGGARTGVISPALDELVEEGFLDDFKDSSQILAELRRKTVPVSDARPVVSALTRRVPKKLDRIRDQKGKWVYRKKI